MSGAGRVYLASGAGMIYTEDREHTRLEVFESGGEAAGLLFFCIRSKVDGRSMSVKITPERASAFAPGFSVNSEGTRLYWEMDRISIYRHTLDGAQLWHMEPDQDALRAAVRAWVEDNEIDDIEVGAAYRATIRCRKRDAEAIAEDMRAVINREIGRAIRLDPRVVRTAGPFMVEDT